MRRILIAGGIGCGKTIVSRIVETMGYPVYDCDKHAKRIMEESASVKEQLLHAFPECHDADKCLDRKLLARDVFSRPEKLSRLNAIVHGSVREDLERWFVECEADNDFAFVETAIPATSHIDGMVDDVWLVTAPMNLREHRVRTKRNMSRADFLKRVESQRNERIIGDVKRISNDDLHPILPRIFTLLEN